MRRERDQWFRPTVGQSKTRKKLLWITSRKGKGMGLVFFLGPLGGGGAGGAAALISQVLELRARLRGEIVAGKTFAKFLEFPCAFRTAPEAHQCESLLVKSIRRLVVIRILLQHEIVFLYRRFEI